MRQALKDQAQRTIGSFFILVSVLIVGAATAPCAWAQSAAVHLDLPPGLVSPGDQVTGDIVIDMGVEELGAYTVTIDCTAFAAELDIIDPVGGGTTSPFTVPPIQNVRNGTNCDAVLTAFQPGPGGPTGAVSVATISFQVDPTATPDSTITIGLSADVVANSAGQSLLASGQGATVNVGGICGNGTVEGGEDCDDGNTVGGDCCAADCLFESSACDDGDLCTTGDVCGSGVCTGIPVDCSSLDGDCTLGACNAGTGACESQPVNEGGFCSDGDACTTSDSCTGGNCIGTPLDCTILDGPCTIGVCNPVTVACEAQAGNEGGACDDGDACTQVDSCQAGTCVGAVPVVCTASDQCHAVGVCDPASGLCSDPLQPDATACDDGDACTTSDVCLAGVCIGGSAPNCDDGNVCTDDSCDPATGCVNTNNTAPCDDGDACTTADTCSGGACVGGAAPNCDDGDVCTDDSCDPATGCVNTNNTAPCDDGDACTTADTCSGGACVGGAAPNCDDGDVCTDDSCDPATGCVNTNNTAP
ncbi:MAG: hypothetical protein ACE5E4_12725, partial [Candidatus Binatia bacterium]